METSYLANIWGPSHSPVRAFLQMVEKVSRLDSMTTPYESSLQKIHFYATAPYSCSYLAGQLAQSLIAAPHHLINEQLYDGLIKQGF